MSRIAINIELIPYKDGLIQLPDKVCRTELQGLIIGTNGKSRLIDLDGAHEIIKKLENRSTGNFLENTPYIMIFDGDRIFKAEGNQYFVGSVLILKHDQDRLCGIPKNELKHVKSLFGSRIVTLCAEEITFSAYEDRKSVV